MKSAEESLALYVHWPFCVSKCPYCDFNSRAVGSVEEEVWLGAYRHELDSYAELTRGRSLSSIYFGGGTPSLMSEKMLDALMTQITGAWRLADACEVTLEANPSSSEAAKFLSFRASGINRLSLGVQSLRDEALKFLGRAHDAASARRALEDAARVFPRFSFDLIYARAGQSLEAWRDELDEALSFGAKHMSLYQLTLEEGTAFYKQRASRTVTAAEEAAEAMFDATFARMREAGLPSYEISNYAAPGEESRHNLTYWRYGDYIGVGAGAHGRLGIGEEHRAIANLHKPEKWAQTVEEKGRGFETEEVLSDEAAMEEALLMGLRIREGISSERWEKRWGKGLLEVFGDKKIQRLIDQNWAAFEGGRLTLTFEGSKRLNAILGYLVGT